MRSFLLTIIGITCVFIACAQTTFLNFHQLTVEEGLSESTNHFLYMDEDAFTWIGSLDGLNLYDGKEVVVYKNNMHSFKGIDVQSSFFEDEKGDIWFTTGEAINCYRKAKGKFDYYFAGDGAGSVAKVHTAFHLDNKQFLWGTVDGRLFKFDTQTRQTAFIGEDLNYRHAVWDTDNLGVVRALYSYNSGGTEGVEIRNFVNDYELTKPQKWFGGDGKDIPAYRIFLITPNVNDRAEACFLTDKGLLFFNPNNPDMHKIYPFPPDFRNVIHMEQLNNELWLVNNTVEIARFDLKQDSFLHQRCRAYNLDEKEPIDNINRIFVGRDTTLWIAVEGEGLYFTNMKNQGTFSLFRRENLLPYGISRFFEYPNGDIWATSGNGRTWVFDADNRLKDTLSLSGILMQVRLRNGEVWAISEEGLQKMHEGQSLSGYIPIPKDPWIFDLIPFKEKYLLVGTSYGILFFDTEEKSSEYLEDGDGDEFAVKILVDNQDQIWRANASDQLIVGKINEDNLSIEEQRSFNNMGIMNDLIFDAYRNIIWVATSKGLVSITADSLQESILTESDGLINQYIRSIEIDKNNNLWLSTNRGIIKFIPDYEKRGRHKFKHLSSRDGLSAEIYNSAATLMSSAGELWAGSTQGIDVIDPDLENIGTAPKLAISSLKIYDEEWNEEQAINEQQQISLPYDKSTLTFKLSALEYTDPKRNQFKTYLTHDGRTDSALLKSNTITYANLAPDNYTFEFTACNAEGIWQEQKHKLLVEVTPPFYQTWWFRTLVTLAVLALVSFISSFYYRYQLQIKQLELDKIAILKAEQERIKDEVHDQMGRDLSTIILISKQAETKVEMEEALEVIYKRSLSLQKNMRHLVWTLSAENSSLEDLVAKLRYDTATFLADNKIEAVIQTPDEISEVEVASKVRHYIVLVVNELLHNILKHAAANKVEFIVEISDQLNITIADDGKGFDEELFYNNINGEASLSKTQGNGHGLKSCKKRIDAIQGDIEWKSIARKGTSVSIAVKLEALA